MRRPLSELAADTERTRLYLRVAVVLAGANMLMLFVGGLLVDQVLSLRDQIERNRDATVSAVYSLRASCERNNGHRAATRWLLKRADAPVELQNRSGIQERNCAADFPLP